MTPAVKGPDYRQKADQWPLRGGGDGAGVTVTWRRVPFQFALRFFCNLGNFLSWELGKGRSRAEPTGSPEAAPHPGRPRTPLTFSLTPPDKACSGAASRAGGAGTGAACPMGLTAAWCTRARSPLTFPMSRLETHGQPAGRTEGACRKRAARYEGRVETAARRRVPPISGRRLRRRAGGAGRSGGGGATDNAVATGRGCVPGPASREGAGLLLECGPPAPPPPRFGG